MTVRKFESVYAPEELVTFFDDFLTYVAAHWTITTTEAGSGAATEALGSGLGGDLVVTNDDADNDADFFQKPGEAFLFTVGKPLQFIMRFKLSDVLEADFIAGLIITDTAPLANTDGIYFIKNDADTGLDFVVNKDSTLTTIEDVATLVDDTFVELEFYYDGASADIDIFVDGVRIASAPLTNVPDDEELTPTFGIQNGEAVAKVLTVDYIGATQVR